MVIKQQRYHHGRLAAGGDKKNAFVSPLNIQNIPKPHVTNHFVIPENICKEYYPEVIEAIDKSGTLEEAETDLRYIDQNRIKELCDKNGFDYNQVKQTGKRWSYRIFGYVVSEEPWLIPGVEEGVVEGFIQELNSRSCFLPDPEYYFVTLDFNAEEIRIPALWSKEPAWLNAFRDHKDVHKSTACSIWGEENYTKDKRKMAKGANFGLLYGMTAHNFKDRFNISYEEAQEFVDQFKAGLPTLFNWIKQCELEGEKFGTVYTMFGRPRRVKSWFDTGEWSWVSFAKRTCVNTKIQGTGADILKIVMIKLFNQFYKTGLTELIRFKFTIHDEIDYQIVKDKKHNYAAFKKILKMVMQIMRVQQPSWEFPMEVGLSIGNRWGQTIDFDFDVNTLEVTGPKQDPISDNDICKALKIERKKEEPERVTDSERSDESLSSTIGPGWNGETISY